MSFEGTVDASAPEVSRWGLPIGEVSDLLNVPAPTIRSWERRYGIPAPANRSRGGHRRFDLDDITALQLMRDEVARGSRPADAAAWVKRQHEGRLPHQSEIDALLAAALGLRGGEIIALLDQARATHGLVETAQNIVMPTMRRVGVWWQQGRCDTAHEHLASASVLTWLHRLPCQTRPPEHPGAAILACGPNDHHSLGLELMAVILRDQGFDVRTLGQRVPTSALVKAIRTADAPATVVVSHLASARRQSVESLTAASATSTDVFYAGNAFARPTAREGVPGTYLGEELGHAAETIAASLATHKVGNHTASRSRP